MEVINSKTKVTRFAFLICIVGYAADEFIIIIFCYERAGLVAVSQIFETNEV